MLKRSTSKKTDIKIAVYNTNKPKKESNYIYLDKDDDIEASQSERHISIDKKTDPTGIIPFIDIPKIKSIRIFISGSTGSGKTYLCEQILKSSFNKAPNIYLFSSVNDDYKKFDNLLHVDIEQFNKSNADVDIYDALEPGSVCIFDDILSFGDKTLKLYLKLRSQCLATGRHKQISTICIEQQPRNFIKSRDVLLNSEAYCFFPRASYLPYYKTCIDHIGMSKIDIEKFGKDSRWVFINKTYPSYVVRQYNIDLI